MKLRFVLPKIKADPWVQEGIVCFQKKLSGFCTFEMVEYKTLNVDRDRALEKINFETTQLTKILEKNRYILFDEKGKSLGSSTAFAKQLDLWIEAGVNDLAFVIGGAYGVSEEIKRGALARVKLSDATMNHHIATLVGLEQIYRGLTILRGLPYHNS